jgi:hypothetical protein
MVTYNRDGVKIEISKETSMVFDNNIWVRGTVTASNGKLMGVVIKISRKLAEHKSVLDLAKQEICRSFDRLIDEENKKDNLCMWLHGEMEIEHKGCPNYGIKEGCEECYRVLRLHKHIARRNNDS